MLLKEMKNNTDWHAEYDAWGNPHNLTQLIRLPGQQYDEESGLYYNRHRYYDPLQGRYITQDPIGLRGGWNVYAYPLDPVGYIDPLGQMSLFPKEYPNYGLDTPPEGLSEMEYSPDFWNTFSMQRSNNCYSYAINRPYISVDHPLVFNTPSGLSCSRVNNILENSNIKKIDPSGNCPAGYHKISLFIDPGKDFHFYRQEKNGLWTHKRGTRNIESVDSDGLQITNPEEASRSYKSSNSNYSEHCGVYCAKN